MDKVSIIVPIYNVEAYLRRCVDSLLAQDYDNIEIILIDDCSTDNSAEIAKGYAESHAEKCRFVQREKNGGAPATRNTGIEFSRGEWITFVDSDDWVTENYVTEMLEVAVKHNMDIVVDTSGYRYYDNGKIYEEKASRIIGTESSHKEKVALLRISTTRALWKSELFFKYDIRFPEEIWRCDDICVAVSLYTMTEKIAVIHVPTYYYFQRSTSISNQNYADLDFYPKAIEIMYELSMSGFEEELEFHAISEMMYGMIMIMVRSKRSNKEIIKHIEWFNKKFPHWHENKYIPTLVKGKRIFIYTAGKSRVILLRAMVWAWNIKTKMLKK